MMRLRKGAETVMRALNDAVPERVGEGLQGEPMKMMTLGELPPEPESVECDVWYDFDGNPCAWSPVGSGVISIEIGEPDKDAPVEIYQALKDAERKAKSAEERIAELEAMVARLAAKMAE